MKFNVTKEKLLEGLQQGQNVVSTRTTLPILSNVLLQAKGNEVHVATTELAGGAGALKRKWRKKVPPPFRRGAFSILCASCLRAKSRSTSMARMPRPFAA